MRATGVVRRIDDLGRVVVPKEIRRTMRIREGDPLEIYTAADGEVILKKYSPIGELNRLASQYCEVISKNTPFAVLVTDRDNCVAAAGISKKEVLDREVSETLIDYMDSRQTYTYTNDDPHQPSPLRSIEHKASVIMPIISAGDVVGSVILLSTEQSLVPSESDIKLASVAAGFLGKQMEE